MARSLRFYRELGFSVRYGGEEASFTRLHAGGFLNLAARLEDQEPSWWGRVILYVSDVDAFYEWAVASGLTPVMPQGTLNGPSDSSTSSIPMGTN